MTPLEDNNTPQAQTKVCCSQECEYLGYPQPVGNFARNRSAKDGFQDFCRKCMARVKNGKSNNYPRIPDDQKKICRRCETEKFAADFYSNKSKLDGLAGYCKSCTNEARSLWGSMNRNTIRLYNHKYYEKKAPYKVPTDAEKNRASCRRWSRNNWASKSVRMCRYRASKKGIPFGMNESDLFDKSTGKLPVYCPIFPNIILDYGAGNDQRLWASVDKIVSELGYVSGNVWVVSMTANRWKSNGSNPAERARIVKIMTGKKSTPQTKSDDGNQQGLLFPL